MRQARAKRLREAAWRSLTITSTRWEKTTVNVTPSTSYASASRRISRGLPRTCIDVEYEITLRNHKTTPISIEVNEPIGGTWRMLQSSHAFTKTDAWAAQFNVPVAADGTAVLKYRVRVTY
jgi:hypothetical protein